MAKILGLDLGTNSIGWAVIEVDDNGKFIRIISCGVRIFPKGVNVDTKFKESSKNQDRRIARGTRRRYFRYKLRRERLVRELARIGIIPDGTFFTNQRKQDTGRKKSELWNHTYELFSLRKKALTERVSLPELGRIFLHINKHRGFKSNKKDEAAIFYNENANKESGEVKKRTNALHARMQELGCETIGEYYFYLLEQNKKSYNPNEPKIEQTGEFEDAIRGKGAYTLREMFENEFEKIWEKQSEFYPETLTPENRDILRDDCIFYQRKLRSAQHLRNKCSLEYKTVTVYLFDKERLLPEIDKIKFKLSTDDDFSKLTEIQKTKLIEFIKKHKYKASISDIISTLNLWSITTKEQRSNTNLQFVFRGLPITKQVLKKYLHCAPISSFEYQEYRIWEQLNRLRYTNSDVVSEELSEKQKLLLADTLSAIERIPLKGRAENSVIKLLNLPPDTEFNIEQKELIGNRTQARLIEVLGEEKWNGLSDASKRTLWHNIHFADDREWLKGDAEFISRVQKAHKRRYRAKDSNYSFKKDWEEKIQKLGLAEKADGIAGLTFEPDYAPFSSKALKKLLVFMKQGAEVVTASREVYKKYISEIQDSNLKLEFKIPPLSGNSLKNPIVERALVEAIGIINAVIDEHGKPDKIRIEMGRELKMPKEARENLNLRNKTIKDRRTFYADFLNKHADIKRNNFEASSPDIKKFEMFLELNYSQEAFNQIKKYITANEFYSFLGARIPANKEKYLLWLECDRMDPYEGKTISLSQLIESSEVEIEHIIPYSRCMDNSMMNKTLAFRKFNAIKGNRTPLECFGGDKSKLDEFKDRIKHFPEAKRERFLMESEKLGGFLNSQITNNAYIATQIREHLLKSFKTDQIEMTNGQMTEVVRSSLALDQILNPTERADGYNIRGKAWCIYNRNEAIKFIERKNDNPPAGYDGYKVVKGSIYNNRFFPTKNRNDHRHHAVDAFVTALTGLRTQKALTACTEGYYVKDGTKYSIVQMEGRYRDFSLLENDIENEQIQFVPKFEEKDGRYIFSREARTDFRDVLVEHLGLSDSFQILEDSKEIIQAIFVSHKNDKIDSQPRKRLYNPNGTPKMVKGKDVKYQARSGGDYVRANMFEANPYGQTNDCAPNEFVKRVKLSFGNQGDYFKEESHFEKIVDSGVRKAIYDKIDSCAKNYASENSIPFDLSMEEFRQLRQRHVSLSKQFLLVVQNEKEDKREVDLKLESLKGIKTSSAKDERKRLKEIKTAIVEKSRKEKNTIQTEINQLTKLIGRNEKTYDFLFKEGAKIASSKGFFLKNEGKRVKRLNLQRNIELREDIPIKKVRIKYISNTMIQTKEKETPRNKKFLKPDANYAMAVYGGINALSGERSFQLISWYDKARIDADNKKRLVQGLAPKSYYPDEMDNLQFLFGVRHNDLFLVFDDDPMTEINFTNNKEMLLRMFIVNDFDSTGKIVLKRNNIPLTKSATKEDPANDYMTGEGKVLRRGAGTLNAIPLKLNRLGVPDINRAKAFIEEHTKQESTPLEK